MKASPAGLAVIREPTAVHSTPQAAICSHWPKTVRFYIPLDDVTSPNSYKLPSVMQRSTIKPTQHNTSQHCNAKRRAVRRPESPPRVCLTLAA